MASNVGDRLKEIRQKLEFNQAEFGIKLSVSRQAVYNIEKNTSFFSQDSLSKLALLNVNIDWLLTGRGEPFVSDNP